MAIAKNKKEEKAENLAVMEPEEDAPPQNTGMQFLPDSENPGMQGDFSPEDIRWPRMQIMQKTSKLVETEDFSFLDLVLNGGCKVADEDKGCEFHVLSMLKYWEEYIPFAELSQDNQPQRWKTEKEAKAAGFSSLWIAGKRPDKMVEPKLVAALLVKCPDGELKGKSSDEEPPDAQAYFPLEYTNPKEPSPELLEVAIKENGAYGLYIFEMKGTNYTNVAKPLITALTNPAVKEKIQTVCFKLKTQKGVSGKNTFGKGTVSRVRVASDEFGKWAVSLLTGR